MQNIILKSIKIILVILSFQKKNKLQQTQWTNWKLGRNFRFIDFFFCFFSFIRFQVNQSQCFINLKFFLLMNLKGEKIDANILSLGIDKPIANDCGGILHRNTAHRPGTFCNKIKEKKCFVNDQIYVKKSLCELKDWKWLSFHEPIKTFMDLNLLSGIFPWVPLHENTDAATLVNIILRLSFINSSALVFWHSKNLERSCSTSAALILQSLSNIWNAAGCGNGNSGKRFSS